MNYAIYIGAAAVIGLLIGVTALSVGLLRKTVMKNIRSRTRGLISIYDTLLEEKSRQLADMEPVSDEQDEVQEKKEPKAKARAVLPSSSELLTTMRQTGATAYRDGAVGGIYKIIRENFAFSPEQVVDALKPQKAKTGPAGRLLSKLTFDAAYELSTLPAQEQIGVLQEILSEEEFALVTAYNGTHKAFRILEFYDELKAMEWAETQPVRVRMSREMAASVSAGEGVEVIPDDGICEGYEIEVEHVLYDYSIRARELS